MLVFLFIITVIQQQPRVRSSFSLSVSYHFYKFIHYSLLFDDISFKYFTTISRLLGLLYFLVSKRITKDIANSDVQGVFGWRSLPEEKKLKFETFIELLLLLVAIIFVPFLSLTGDIIMPFLNLTLLFDYYFCWELLLHGGNIGGKMEALARLNRKTCYRLVIIVNSWWNIHVICCISRAVSSRSPL